ncbi:MAG TPA: V-type ATP synthase subunit F [Anaerolineales bacterium]|jgi:V/A-type H+-transporting ATPase subunit F|nr:V-type ATP synthase subunit F [Anaerolineales bacterium]
MKILVIGHPDAVLGFSLAGVSGREAKTADEINQALDDVQASKDVGIVLVTQDVAELIPARMEHLKLRSTIPLVVEIPAHGTATENEMSLGDIVLRAIGIKL